MIFVLLIGNLRQLMPARSNGRTSLDLSAEEWREALRACKGMMLRQEIYELDVDALARGEEQRVKLFSTAFHNCHIQQLQHRGTNRHAVFLVTESEAITYHYELDLRSRSVPLGVSPALQPDPRIAHTLNLRIDEYENVLESVAIAYPRIAQHEDASLPDGAEAFTTKTITNCGFTDGNSETITEYWLHPSSKPLARKIHRQ